MFTQLRFGGILLFSLTLAGSTSPIERDRLYIWNIGQGSWSTVITARRCLHFDMGGEYFVSHSALALCRSQLNILFLSHLDTDHISFIPKAARLFRELCLVQMPPSLEPAQHVRKKAQARQRHMVAQLPVCRPEQLEFMKKSGIQNIMFHSKAHELKTSNDLSQIYTFERWLFTGDSSKKSEELWVPNLVKQLRRDHAKIEFLVVGHHGSRTSTSALLLKNLPDLKMAVVSARWRKYRHPHTEVVAALQKNKTPLLITEKWGHLIFEL